MAESALVKVLSQPLNGAGQVLPGLAAPAALFLKRTNQNYLGRNLEGVGVLFKSQKN